MRKHTCLVGALVLFLASVTEARWVWEPDTGFTDSRNYEMGNPRELYEAAVAMADDGKHADAAREFSRIARYTPDAVYQEKAQFQAAEELFAAGQHYRAHLAYEQYLAYYPRTDRLKDILRKQMEVGLKLLQGARRDLLGIPLLSGRGTGLEMMRRLLGKYPYEDFSDEYHYLLANSLFERQEYDEASLEYELFLKTYPDSEWTPTARFQLAQCHLKVYQGPAYDPAPAQAARKELENYVSANPQGDKFDAARDELARLDEEEAEKEYHLAEFYLRRDKPASALIYLHSIIRKHPSSSWAEKAREVIGTLEGRPAEEGSP